MKTRLLIFALALATPLSAQTPLTLQDAVTLALERHPALALADATLARARSNLREAEAARRPSMSIDAHLNRFQEPMVVAPLHGFDPQNPPVFDRTLMQGSVSLNYSLFDAARGARIERAAALGEASETGQEAARMQVIAEVARAYLRVQSARQLEEAQRHRIRALETERERARQLVEQGRAARVMLLRADAALSAAQAESAASHSDVEAAENELARQVGATPAQIAETQLAAVAPARALEITPEEARAAARTAPELERFANQIEAAEALRREARGLWLPKVQLNGRYVEYASAETTPQGEWQAGLQLSYPLLTGGVRQAANSRAAAEVDIARAESNLAQRRVDEAIDRAMSAYVSARTRAAALQAAVAQSEEVTRIDRLALEEGAGVQSDYLTAEADLFRARAALADARAMELVAMVDLARITGRLTPDWIAQNVESRQ